MRGRNYSLYSTLHVGGDDYGRVVVNTEITTQYTGEWGDHPATAGTPYDQYR